MRIESEQAFVLHARPWRETSLLVELLTERHGRVGAVARGVQGPRQQARRAALQPWQRLSLDADARGDLWTLRRWEAVDVAPRLVGDAALAGFYVHELLMRLLPRADAVPEVFTRHGALRGELAAGGGLAWCLRRWERDVLEALGVGLDWGHAVDGLPVDPAARYRIDPEQGAWRDPGQDRASIRGSALRALAEDRCPPPGELADLRRALRAVIEHHLDGRPLKAWSLIADVQRVTAPEGGDA
ncbi:MAG: DNA repair protein RecO [Lysobacteraceae bacterium]|jgi:DNA repair protein RecO (recombination protein O)|nr:DNA repair protein RecO [Xanthomonadaceae bacterium]MCZ8318206.1 DNA repair protein RecO [Silanimonas sp.]